jgi:hypothetical protein
MRFILGMSLLLNGLLAGMIVGHLTTVDAKVCQCRHPVRDEGDVAYPTGWVVPDDTPPKPDKSTPAGEAR